MTLTRTSLGPHSLVALERSLRAAVGVLLAALALVVVSSAMGGCPHASGGALQVMAPLSTTDDDADRLLREADRAADEGRVDEAAARYRELIERHPDDRIRPLAELGLGRVHLAAGRNDEAIATLLQAEAGDDAVVRERAQLYRGVALHLTHRPAEAVPLLAPLLGHTTDPAETRLLLDTLATAAAETGDALLMLRALDALVDATDERERPAVVQRVRDAAQSRLADEDVTQAFGELRRSGTAWPFVAARALRQAHDAGDVARVRAIAGMLAEQGIALDSELATLVSRAERLAQADVRVIGAILPLTGPARELGQRALRGLTLAAGTPGDRPAAPDAPQLVFRDDASDPERAARAVEELVSVHRAVAIVGPLDPACAERAAARARELGVPLLSLAPVDVPGESLAFRLYPTLEDELRALAETAFARGARRFAVLHPDTGWGRRVVAMLNHDLVARGATLAADVPYATSATSFTAEVAQVVASQPDAVLVADASAKVALLTPALASAGLWSPRGVPAAAPARRGRGHTVAPRAVELLVPSVGFDVRLPRTAGRYLQGALFAVPFLPPAPPATTPSATTSPATPAPSTTRVPTDLASFVALYRERFQAEPDVFAAYAFDGFGLVRRAVLAGATDRPGVASWLLGSSVGTPTLGASGGFDARRRPFRGPQLVELVGESFQVVARPPVGSTSSPAPSASAAPTTAPATATSASASRRPSPAR